ncbi:unnamed protein product [Cyprideis torosa]|uniref:Uncharacterized protein n=1 Tax=Cyprideis torosa TaxID=163714 RepID=A0A7R8ZTB8_9CRUS|nr:unnamed protein product [Cyprideis torosa]CAG0903668.1 unnamed protein product [Cyprideis torosa]
MSAERLVSGTGMTEFYQVICRLDGMAGAALTAEQISSRAVDGSCARCAEVMTLFCEWLGIIASNLALIMGATGGVYIGGGIVPKLGDYFLQSGFRRFERDYAELLEQLDNPDSDYEQLTKRFKKSPDLIWWYSGTGIPDTETGPPVVILGVGSRSPVAPAINVAGPASA